MTNAKKYLKDGVEAKEIWHNYQEFLMNNDKTENACTFVEFMEEKEKLQLTEDERVILKNIPTKYWQKICRDNYGVLEIRGEYEKIDFHEDNISDFDEYNHLFQFIKNGEEYSIEELLNEDKS